MKKLRCKLFGHRPGEWSPPTPIGSMYGINEGPLVKLAWCQRCDARVIELVEWKLDERAHNDQDPSQVQR